MANTETSGLGPQLNIIGIVMSHPEIKVQQNKDKTSTYCRQSYMVSCGGSLIRVSSVTDLPPVDPPKFGDKVQVMPVPGWKDDGVIKIEGTCSKV